MARWAKWFCMWLALGSAWAFADEAPQSRLARGSVTLQAGGVGRSMALEQSSPDNPVGQPLTVSGFSATALKARADFFFLRWLGLDVDAALDTFVSTNAGKEVVQHVRFDLRALAAVRLTFGEAVGLQFGLGYGHGQSPWRSYALTSSGSYSPIAGTYVTNSVAARVGLQLVLGRFEGLLDVTLVPGFSDSGSGARPSPTSLEPRLNLGVRLAEFDTFAVSAVVEYSALFDTATEYHGQFHRVTGGLRFAVIPERKVVTTGPEVTPLATPTALKVAVVLKGVPAAGALVSLDGAAPVPLDERGERTFETTPGAHEVTVTLAGQRPLKLTAVARANEAVALAGTLTALDGPGFVMGVVRAAATKQPVVGASVLVGEQKVDTDENGAFRLERVGPGPVSVQCRASGFSVADEVVQVPPEAQATLDFALEALGKGSPATVRGLIRSRTGEALKASVVIKGVAKKVEVSSEGRFVVTIPGGEYLFVISAPGYVSQTKKVTLADGDQAIFHSELQKAGN